MLKKKFSKSGFRAKAKPILNKNKKFSNNSNPLFKVEYKNKFDKNFGNGSFSKLIDAKNKYSKDLYIRVNSSKISKTEIEQFLKKNRAKFSNTFFDSVIKIDRSFFNISSSLPSLLGDIYIQDLASQIPINLIDFSKFIGQKEIRILDMAASPGSKTTQIIDKCKFLKINCKIVALEPNKLRLQRLINNIQKQECENVEIINIEAQNYKDDLKFDIILLDAPCSGNLIDDDRWLSKRDFKGIEEKSNLQKKLIKNASNLLEKDGVLVYSTCSLELEENEENVLWAENNTNLKSVKVNSDFDFETSSTNIFFDKKLKETSQNLKFSEGLGQEISKKFLSYDEQDSSQIVLKKNSLKYSKINCLRFQPYISKTQGFFVGFFEIK